MVYYVDRVCFSHIHLTPVFLSCIPLLLTPILYSLLNIRVLWVCAMTW